MSDRNVNPEPGLHKCEDQGASYMEAVTSCTEFNDGTLMVGNGEYGSRVDFCPFCGYAARTKCGKDITRTTEPTRKQKEIEWLWEKHKAANKGDL